MLGAAGSPGGGAPALQLRLTLRSFGSNLSVLSPQKGRSSPLPACGGSGGAQVLATGASLPLNLGFQPSVPSYNPTRYAQWCFTTPTLILALTCLARTSVATRHLWRAVALDEVMLFFGLLERYAVGPLQAAFVRAHAPPQSSPAKARGRGTMVLMIMPQPLSAPDSQAAVTIRLVLRLARSSLSACPAARQWLQIIASCVAFAYELRHLQSLFHLADDAVLRLHTAGPPHHLFSLGSRTPPPMDGGWC